MSEVRLRFSERGLKRATQRLERLLERVADTESVMDEAAAYMVRSTQQRLYRDKRAPDGTLWEELHEITQVLRAFHGYNPTNTLVMTGELARSVQIEEIDGDGFTIVADAEHASYQQYGVKRVGGIFRGTEIPARPFMGFSDTNIRTIARMVNAFILEEGADE